MKILIHILLTIILIILTQKTYPQEERWTLGTADNLDKFHFEIGAFQPARFGLTNKIEFSTLALSNIFVPNLSLQKQWWERKILIATKHGIYYTKPGLNMARKTG